MGLGDGAGQWAEDKIGLKTGMGLALVCGWTYINMVSIYLIWRQKKMYCMFSGVEDLVLEKLLKLK